MDSQDDQNQEQQQKKHRTFLCKISYTDDPQSVQPRKYRYSSETLTPFLYFYKLLAYKPCERAHRYKLILNIPDTIVFNDSDNPVMWFYTNSKGQVVRIDNIPYFQITSKMAEGALEKQVVAVLKKVSYGYSGPSGNDVKIVTASQVKTVLSMILAHRSQLSVLQRFIKSSSVRPSIVRTCWRSNNNNQSWVLNSSYQYASTSKVPQINKMVVNTKVPHAFKATKSVSIKFTQETLKYVRNIVQFVSRNLKIKFKEFVCDFIKDQGGNWWFINVKAFILQGEPKKINIKPIVSHDDDYTQQDTSKVKKNMESYTKCKKCKYCQKNIADHLMSHKLTLMMILQCDQHLIKIGKSFPWLQRCYKQHVNSVNLYVEHKVCDSCYKLYTQVQKLMELDKKMAKITGVSLKDDNKNLMSITAVPTFKGYSKQFGSRFQKIKYDTEMPKDWGLPKDQQIIIGLQDSGSKMVNRCRFMFFIHGIRDIPLNFQHSNQQFTIQYKFLDQKVCYKIDLSQCQQFQGLLKVMIDKMKIFYFFSVSRQDIVNFVKTQQTVKISLFRQKQLMGQLELQLQDFKSDKVIKKDYFKMFSGPKVFPYLSWGLFISVGIYSGQSIGTNSLKLTRKKHLFLPQHGYHCPQLLPAQWIEMIQDKKDKLISNKSIRSSSQQQRSAKSLSQISLKDKVKKQAIVYSKKRAESHQKIKRKVYY